jgi:hypothetical protein
MFLSALLLLALVPYFVVAVVPCVSPRQSPDHSQLAHRAPQWPEGPLGDLRIFRSLAAALVQYGGAGG